MARPSYSDEILMAFADGELDEAKSREVAAAVAKIPALAKKVEAFRRTRNLVSKTVSPLAQEKVPDALLAAVKAKVAALEGPSGSQVIAFPARAPRPANYNWRSWAVAAGVAAVVAGLAGFVSGRQFGPSSDITRLALEQPVGGAIGQRLARLPSGAEESWDDRRIKMIASFADPSGRLCREFEYDAVGKDTFVGVACRAENDWRLTFAVEAPPADGGYAPASSTQALDAYLSAIGVEATMTPAQEKDALAKLR